MEEFKKIDLVSANTPTSSAGEKKSFNAPKLPKFKLPTKGAPLIALVVVGVLALIFFFAVLLPAQRTYASARKTYDQAKKALDAIKKQNVALAGEELVKTKAELVETQKSLHAMGYAQFIPLVGWYYSDADHMVKAGFEGIDAAITLVDSIKPYADVLGLKGQGSFVMGSAEDRIKTAILTMGKVTPRIDTIAESLIRAQKEIDAVDPNHYPPFFGGDKIRNQLISLQQGIDAGVVFVDEARPLIKVLPSLLGEKEDKKYLILFQNDLELRPTGGFLTAYAIFRVDKGVIHVDASDDIYNLDNRVPNKKKAPEPILKYLPKVPLLNLRDSNLSPDFVESMKTFNSLYNTIPGKTEVDGIIALDTSVLVSVLKILDDSVTAGGINFTTKKDDRCDCPQVIYVLEDNISRPVNYVKGGGRKDLLGSLLYALMEKALKSSPKLYWGPLMQDFLAQVNKKHVMFYLYDKNAQAGIDALNAAGRIVPAEGDYLHINESNMGGAKSNLFVSQTVTQEYSVKGDGAIVKTVTVNYKNPFAPSDCNLERGGLCLNAVLRDWIRVYVPKGSKLVDSKGSEVKVSTYDELGKTVFEGFLTVRPQGTAVYTLSYTLPFKLASGSPLPLLIQKQPGTEGDEYTIKTNGRTLEKFELLTDKEVKLKL